MYSKKRREEKRREEKRREEKRREEKRREEKRRRDHRAAMVGFGRRDGRGQTCHTTRWFLATQRAEHTSRTLEFWVGTRWQSISERRISEHTHILLIPIFGNRGTEPIVRGVTRFEIVREEKRGTCFSLGRFWKNRRDREMTV
jgi:hypothetical protein